MEPSVAHLEALGTAMEKETGRVEAFSDGVFAVAITLLVLDLKVPSQQPGQGAGLTEALLAQWPAYVAYVTSFLTILIMWINHHNVFTYIRRTDHLFLILNGLLLMFVTLVPFTTSLIADYFQKPDERTAAIVFNGTFVMIAIVYNLLWRYASRHKRLLDRHADTAAVDQITRGYRVGPLVYAVTFLVGLVDVAVSLALALALAIYFALPATSAGRSLLNAAESPAADAQSRRGRAQ